MVKKKSSKKKVSYNNKTIVIGVIVLVILFVFAFAYQGSREDEEGLGSVLWDGNGDDMDDDMDEGDDMDDAKNRREAYRIAKELIRSNFGIEGYTLKNLLKQINMANFIEAEGVKNERQLKVKLRKMNRGLLRDFNLYHSSDFN
jgi:hypothetical protein